MNIRIDRSLPVSIHHQVRGQIQYAIITGELKRGELMPSVRSLAERLGVAPATVLQAYQELAREGLLHARAGVGTFVANALMPKTTNTTHLTTKLAEIIDAAIIQARSEGFTNAEIGRAVFARLAAEVEPRKEVNLGLVGVAEQATNFYAEEIAKILRNMPVRVVPFTTNQFYEDPEGVRRRLRETKLLLAPANLAPEVRSFLQDENIRILKLSFVISDVTRETLVRLPRVQPVGIVATFPEFLLTLIDAVRHYYPLDEKPLCSIVSDEERTRHILSRVKLVIYATGSERILEWLPPNVQAVEYLHRPDPAVVKMLKTLLA